MVVLILVFYLARMEMERERERESREDVDCAGTCNFYLNRKSRYSIMH